MKIQRFDFLNSKEETIFVWWPFDKRKIYDDKNRGEAWSSIDIKRYFVDGTTVVIERAYTTYVKNQWNVVSIQDQTKSYEKNLDEFLGKDQFHPLKLQYKRFWYLVLTSILSGHAQANKTHKLYKSLKAWPFGIELSETTSYVWKGKRS